MNEVLEKIFVKEHNKTGDELDLSRFGFFEVQTSNTRHFPKCFITLGNQSSLIHSKSP